jgi:uncharacterized protein
MKKYDVIIIGSGPAGMLAAYELTKNSDANIAIFEKGEDREIGCSEVICGFGGAGTFSDGKIHCNSNVGGQLHHKIDIDILQQYIDKVDNIFVKNGAPKDRYFEDKSYDENMTRKILSAGLHLIPTNVHHIGTENAYNVVNNIKEGLLSEGVDIFCNSPVDSFLKENGDFKITSNGKEYSCKHLIVAVGRGGASWLSKFLNPLKIEYKPGSCDVGVRFECKNVIYEHLTDVMYEPKLIYYSEIFDDRTRNFCVNPKGSVVKEKYGQAGIETVNGHSFADEERKTDNINFAILVTKSFTEPFTESLKYIEHICELSNMLAGGGVLVQRVEDLLRNRRSTKDRILRGPTVPTYKNAVPGDLSLAIPYRIMSGIIEYIDALEQIAPGTKTGLIYGIEAKFYSINVNIDKHMQSNIENLYICGDCSGHTRSISQAGVSGILAAENILKKKE